MAKASHKTSDVFKKPSSSLSCDPSGTRLLDGHLKVLRRCRPILLKDLDPVDIVDRLTIDDSLRTDLRDCVLAPKTREERVVALLDRLEKSDEVIFFVFVDALRDRYRHIHSLLEEMIRTNDSEDDDDNFRERTTVPGDVLRKFLRDSVARRHILSERHPYRGGSESCSDPSVDNLREDAEDTEYLPCYVVSSRGKMQKWVKHANGRKEENGLEEPSSAKVYMAVVTKDLVFRRTDRSSLPDLVKQPPAHCHQMYVIDEDSKYSLATSGAKNPLTLHSASFRSTIGHDSRSKNRLVGTDPIQRKYATASPVTENFACSGISEQMPPPLPPKPENLPQLFLFPGGRRRPCGTSSSDEATTLPEVLTSASRCKDVTLQSHEPRVPPIPSGFSAQKIEQRRNKLLINCSTKRVESRTSVGHAEPGPKGETEEDEERQRNSNEEDDDDDISLNFNIELDDTENGVVKEKEDPYEALNPHEDGKEEPGKELVERLPVEVETDTDTICSNVTLQEDVNRRLNDRIDMTIQYSVLGVSSVGQRPTGDSSQTTADNDSFLAKLNARDSGVDSIVSQGFPDSPFGTDAASGFDAELFPTCNLGDIKIPLTAEDTDNSSTDYSYYEEIELLSGRRSPSVYLDPCSSSVNRHNALRPTGGAGYGRTFEHIPCLGASPDQKVIPAGTILIADKDNACLFSEIFPQNRSPDPLAEYADPMANFKGTVLGYDKEGLAYYLPTTALKEYGNPQEEDWFYPIEITSREATLFLTRENQKGCFVVYRPRTPCPGVLYTLSLCRGAGEVLHYHIVENVRGDIKVEGDDRSFMTVCDLVSYFRRNQSHLATRLRRSLRHARVPITPGYQYPERLEIPRSEIKLRDTVIGQGRFWMLCRGQLHGTPVTVKVLQTDASVTEEDDFLEEVQVLMSLRQENIVRLIGVSCRSRPFYIVSEFFDHGTLAECLQNNIIRSDCVEDLFDVCMQIVTALSHLESHHYVLHRSLAAKNFFVSNGMLLKLANFDRARFVHDDSYLACPADDVPVRWAAPEVLFESLYSTKSDVWATGVVFWEVFSRGARPYATLTDEETAVFVTEGGRLERPSTCAHNLFSLMKSCWKPLPTDRPSFAAIYEKFKGDSNVYYYTTQPPNTVSTGHRSSKASDIPQLPMKVKGSSSSSTSGKSLGTPTIHNKVKHSSLVRETYASEGVLRAILENGRDHVSTDRGSHHLRLPGDTSHRLSVTIPTASSSVGDRIQNSSSDSSSVVSASVSNEFEKDLSRGELIRKSIRKLIKGKKTAK